MMLLEKSQWWSYEREWRMFAQPHAANFRGKDQRGLPLYLFDLPSDCVREIIFGHQVGREDRARLVNLTREKYAQAQLYEARLNSTLYDLDIVRLR